MLEFSKAKTNSYAITKCNSVILTYLAYRSSSLFPVISIKPNLIEISYTKHNLLDVMHTKNRSSINHLQYALNHIFSHICL